MAHRALQDELYNAAKRSLADLHAEHCPSSNESILTRLSMKVMLKFAEIKALNSLVKQAEADLAIAKFDYEDFRRGRELTSKLPLPTLPLDIVQYIISLAYDNETLEMYDENDNCNESIDDFGKSYGNRGGARALAYKLHPSHQVLLSKTILPLSDDAYDYSGKSKAKKFDNVRQSKFRVVWLSAPLDRNVERTVRHYAQQVKSLVIHDRDHLEACLQILPYLKEFTYVYHPYSMDDPKWTWLQEIVKKLDCSQLRSATVSSRYLAGFASSGLLDNVNNLRIEAPDGHNGLPRVDRWPTLSQVLGLLSRFPGLISLKLSAKCHMERDNTETNGSEKKRAYCSMANDVCCELPSLRRLHFSYYDISVAQNIAEKLFLPSLTEIVFEDKGIIGFEIGSFSRKLSGMFPQLQILRIPTVKVREVLMGQVSKSDGDGHADYVWNFHRLHTLDVRRGWDRLYESSHRIVDIIDVLRARAISSRTLDCDLEPLNHFYIDSPIINLLKDKECNADAARRWKFENLEECERMILRNELEQIVPNLVWNEVCCR